MEREPRVKTAAANMATTTPPMVSHSWRFFLERCAFTAMPETWFSLGERPRDNQGFAREVWLQASKFDLNQPKDACQVKCCAVATPVWLLDQRQIYYPFVR